MSLLFGRCRASASFSRSKNGGAGPRAVCRCRAFTCSADTRRVFWHCTDLHNQLAVCKTLASRPSKLCEAQQSQHSQCFALGVKKSDLLAGLQQRCELECVS